MEDNKRKLYDALSDEFDLGTYEEFERNIGDSNKRRKLFDAASADYDLGDFESYSQKIGPTHKESLDIFNAENGAFMDDFEARDTAEAKISRAGMSSGLYVPTEGSITGEERQRYMELRQREDALKKAWYTSDEYLEQKDADALQLAKMRDSIDRGRMAYAQENPIIEGYNPSATRGADADKEMQMYETASRIMTDAIKMHNAPGKYDGENVFLKFGKGAGDKASDIDFWTMGLSEIADNLGVREVLSSVQNKLGNLNDLSEEAIENILSPAEKAVLQAWAINAQEQLKRRDDLSRAYQGGQGAVESLGFMAEFALTGGVGKLASEGAETMARWLGKKALTTIGGKADDVAEQIIKETGERIAENTVGKYAAGLGRSLAEAAGRTGVMPSTFRNITEKATEIHTDEEGNNYLVGMNNAFAKGFADSFIENLSEGGRVNALGELIGDVAGKIPAYRRMVDKFSNTKASELLDAFNSSGIMNTLRAGGWHGFGEEYLEEWYGNALRTLTGVDKEALKEFATVDNQIVTITSFLPMTIFGGTVSTAQVLSSKRDLDKKAEALRSALLERGYDEAQANNMIDMMRGSTPAEVSEFLSPIVNSVAGRSIDEAAALMKPVGEFAEAVRRWQAFDTKYKYQEQEQRDDLRSQMESTIGQFWQEDENGRQTVQRGVNAKGEAVYMLGKPSAEEAEAGVASEVAAVTSDGRKVFVNPSDYELEDELEMNDFLGTEIMAEKRNKEQARMIEEEEAQIAAIREVAVPGNAVNIGTAEAPVQAIVIQRNPNGVIVNTPDGQTRQMTYEEFGNYVGINAVPLTDAQIDEQEADALSAERSQREAALDQEYNNEDAAIEELTEAENEIEQVETTTPLPTRADGSVDQTALWNNDPARWAQWNDEQRQDGGANSLAYINGAIARGEAAVAELTAAYNAEPDFDRRASMEQQIAANTERLQGLVNLRDGYVAQAEAPISQTQQRPQTEEEKAKAENQRREPLRKKAKELADKLGVKVNIAESISDVKEAQAKEEILRIDLSGSTERATGWFNPASGEVTIYLPHTTDTKEIERTIVHEVVAHKGLRGLLGEEGFNVLCDSVWDMMTEEERAKFMAYPGVNGNKRAAADEYIAHYAETLNLEESKPIWDRIMDLIMRILNSMGVRLEMSKEQLSDIIVASYQKLVQEANGQTNVESAEASPDKGVSFRLSEEVDENGRQFVLTPNGELAFGEITSDSGLTPAPILLSEGMITNPVTNDGYGLVHIEARHGDQIRKAGYNSVIEFVEEVAKNYEVIREGKNREGIQTYMLQLTDKHNNTLMVELSGDGTYWNINTAGIFKTSYGANRREIYNRHTTAKQSAETAEASQATEQSGTQPTSSMNAPTSSEDKVSENIDTYNTDEEIKPRVVDEASIDEEPSSPFMAAAQQEGESIRFSITTEESLQDKIRKFAKTKDGKKTGWTEDDIESIIAETESLIDAIHRSSTGNEFYDEFAYKEPTIRVDWRDGEAKPIVTWTRANIEYKYDMSADLLCINNEGLEQVLSSDKMVALMEMFITEKKAKKGEPIIKFSAEDYLELYNTLRDLGFVVPCKGCFDAAGRFKMLPLVAQKFAAEVNAVIDERNKDPKAFDEKLKAKAGEETTIEGLPTTASTKSAAIAVGVAGDNLTEHVKWTQLMSADGQTKMLSDWGGIFRAWQRTGAGRPKDKLLPEPYYGDIVSSVSTIIGKYGEKTPSFRDTLVNQGTGLRRNSHSEFRPVLAIDEIQFMRDAFIRNLTVFKYMKELDDVRLFGKMGVKFNMSFFPEYVPGTKVAGLDKEGNYIASEESVGSREFPYQGEDGKRHYDGMKGWAEAQKYVNKDVSLSSVIFSIPHLLKALTDVPTPSDMRGIWGSLIPFHSSGATTASLAMQGLGMARANGVGHGFIEAFTDYGKGVTNFEAVQNDRFGEGWYIVSGKKAGTDVEPGHKLEFANGNHYYNRTLGIHLFASGYILDSELPEGVLGEKGELNITDEQKKALLHKFTIDYNDKVRDIKGPYAYKAAADYYIAELPKLGLIPRFDFEVSEDKFLEMCEAANVDPRHPKLGWKGEGNSWSPIDSEAYYSLFCDYGMTDPATGEWAPHMPVGYVNEKGKREFRLPENAVEIVKDGLERFSEVRRSEAGKIDEAIKTFAQRSVEKGRIKKKDAEKIVGELRMRVSSEGPIDLVEEAKKAQAKHDAKEIDVRMRITPEMESIRDKAKKDGTFMKAPNGKPTNLTEKQWLMVRTKNFINWFGDWINDPANASKIVDENGEPMVMIHGTDAEFTEFRRGKGPYGSSGRGIYFARAPKDLGSYVYGGPDGQRYLVFLNVRNLYEDVYRGDKAMKLNDNGEYIPVELMREIVGTSSYEEFIDSVTNTHRERFDVDELQQIVKGISKKTYQKIHDYFDGKGIFSSKENVVKRIFRKNKAYLTLNHDFIGEIVVRDPNQIKSATDNIGTFDTNNPDIRFRVLDTTKAELKEKPIKLNGMYRFKLKNAFKGVKDNSGSYPYIKVQLEEVSDDYSGEKIVYNGILEGFAVVRIPKGLITEGEKDNVFFIDPKAIENELWDVLRATENYYEFMHGGAPYQRDWLNADEVRFRVTPEQDKAYMDAVKAGDMETAQKMVIEAARLAMPNTKVVDENGYPKVVYHGGSSTFTKFDTSLGDGMTDLGQGSYFSSNEEIARKYTVPNGDNQWQIDSYIEEHPYLREMSRTQLGLAEAERIAIREVFKNAKVYPVFLNMENPYYTTMEDFADGEFAHLYNRDGLRGYDGIIDDTFKDRFEDFANGSVQYVAFEPSQIKSAEPVTYDDAGNVIPLSQRFNPENGDIRFRVRTEEEREKLFADAKEKYGVTDNFNAAGYMLPDGSLLDFSEANDGGDPNSRSLDHRDIEGVIMDNGVEYDSRWMYIADFMNEGAIRLLPESAGINMIQAPTEEQRKKIFDFIYKYNGEVILEINDERLNSIAYMEYDRRTSPSRIFRDIDGYFNDGTIPGIPPIRFRVTEEQRDEVQFRVISDALYEEMDDMIESLVGASFFRRVESEFDLGKKVKNFAEFADLITIIKNNDNYISTGSSLLGFFSSHTDQHFPLLLSVDDKALRKQAEADLKEALSQIDDTYILFYIKEAWKAHKNGLAQAGLGVKPNATTKFNKAIDARIEEIRAGRVKGTSFNFKKQEVSLDEIDTLFKQLNTNEELAVLHDKVMDLAKRFGIKPQFAAIRGAAEGESLGDKVRYDYRAFNSPAISDERKANIITHELIHSVTSYAFYLDDYMPSALTPEMREAINILREVYYAIRRDSSFKDEYGASSVEEMVAELSNTAFREKLKEKSLYQRILDAILKLFGVVKEDSAYNAANEALTYIIENYDENAFNLYARQAARSQEYSKWYNSEDVRFRMSNENQAIFVSNAARAVEGIKQEKATPEQWLKMLEKTGGLKAGEDKWMGLSDWLKASDKKTLTKAEVLDFINESMIIIEEQHYSNEEVAASANKELNEKYPGWEEAFSMDWDGYMDEPYASIWDNETAVELYNNNHEDQIELDEDGEFENLDDESKVMNFGKELAEIFYRGNSDVRPIHGIRSDYQTRGLSDNHEIALTVPTIERWKADDAVHFGDAGDGRAIAWIRFGETKYRPAGIADEIAALDKTILEYEGETSDEEYKALVDKKHALLRASRAQKVLVIDEIQSNRHQEGRKRGYKDIRDIRAVKLRKAEIEAEIEALAGAVLEGDRKAKRQQDALFRELRELSMQRVRGEIPDAPFEKNWAELAMKRMLRYAAENGFDIIAWTTGDQQANRYDLSRDVIKINAYRPNAEGERIVSIYYRDEYNDYKNLTVDKEGKVVQGDYNGSALADVVGKEMALQIMNAEDVTEFKGDGLKIGGEGMRGFYDKMLPAFMRKYGKKWGVTVEDINLPNLGKSGYTMHSVPVTEEMKSSVMEGQVMFRTTAITPEAQEEMDAIHASAIVMGNFMKAPNGQPTNLTEEQWLMVRTKGFKEWFGDWENDPENSSKVVDENGEPKVVFHGGAWRPLLEEKGNAVFKMRGGLMGKGAYFTDKLSTAIEYARDKYGWEHDEEVSDEFLDDNGYVTEVFLNIRNEDNIREYYGETYYLATNSTQIKSATDNTGAFSEGEGDIRFKVVTDPSKIEELESGPRIKVYRAMQLIDGKLYPPMSAKVDGQLRQPIELGQWEEAEERPDLADDKGYFKLDKGNKKSLKARYNPYFHTSPTPLNDQFSSAQSRPELVTVEVEIPASELTSGYKADKAKDSVGEKEWKAGVIQGKLSGTRKVILSRWDKPVRIVPDSEVADVIVKMLEGRDIVMPSNVVTPSLRAELEKRGVPFVETDNKGKPISEFGPIYEQFRGKPKEAVEFLMEKKTGEAVGALNHKDIGDISIVYGNEKAGLKKIAVKHPEVLDILQDILDDATIVQQSENRIKLESGRYFAVISKDYLGKPRAPWLLTSFEKKNSVPDNTMDTGETSKGSKQNDTATLQDTVSESKDSDNIDTSNELDENTSFRVTGTPTEDVVAEGVSLSPAQLASLAGDIFTALPEESRKKITDGLNGNILGLQDAILQIPTSLATKDNWNDEDRQMAEVVAEQMTKAVDIEMTRPFSASEALWTLYNAVNKSTDLVSEASRALVRRNLGFDSQTLEMEKEARDGVRFRTVGNASANAQASMYNRGAANVWTRLKEVYVDMHASVEELVKAIEKRSGKKAEGFENILMALNQQSSRGLAAMEAYEQKFLNKMYDEIRDIMDKTDFKYEDIVRYVILKHGLERNVKMAQRDAKAHYQEIYDDIIAKIKGMNPAQKRTYLTNAQLRDADAKAELAVLQGVNTSALTPDQLRDHKKALAKAKKEAAEAAEHLVRAQKIATMTEQDALDELDKIFKKIEKGTDSVYKEMRKNDYSGISSMFYDTLGVDRKNYATEEEYQAALMQAKADKYDNLGDIEGAAQMEVTLFENAVNTDNLWKSINKATKETLRQQYEANMISKDQYENLRNMFEFYVPLRGFADNTAEDMYTYYRRPNSTGYTKPILGAEGRKTEAESPFGWIAAMAGSAIASNVKNEAKLALYYFVANRPDNGIATLSKTWFVHTPGDVDANGKKIFRPAYPPFNQDLSTDAAKQAYEDWQEQMRDLQKQGLAYEAGQRLNLGNAVVNISDTNKPEHIVNVKVGGKDYTIVINGNPRAAQAINGDLNIETNETYNNVLFGPWLRWLSSVNTSYNPEFWATNMMRDMAFTMMAVNIKGDPAYRRKFKKNYAKAFKVISMVIKNEKGTLGNSYIERMYKDFVKYGGVTGFTQIKDSETWEKEIEKYLKNQDANTTKAIKDVKDVLHAMHRFGESLEQVSRFAAFLTAVETGKSINEAINDAKEITVNFNRKGSGKRITLKEAKTLTKNNGQPLNDIEAAIVSGISHLAPAARSTIMFFNASVQALNAWFKLWKANKLRSLSWVAGYAAVGVMNALIHALLDDDDDYLDMPQYERRSSLMLGGNGVYFKWALPQEMSAFYALGELSVETIFGRNPHQSAAAEAAKVIGDMLPVNIAKIIIEKDGWVEAIPSQVKPFLELVRNEDYKGDVIFNEQKWLSEGERERTANWESAYKGTGRPYIEISKLLNNLTDNKDLDEAGWINIHPESLEHVVESMTGGVGRSVSKLFNTIMAAFDPEEDVTVRQFPFLNRILTINDERYKNVHVNDVYDYYAAEAEHALTLKKKYEKDKDKDSYNKLLKSDEYKWATIYSRYKKTIKQYQEKIKAAEGTKERMELMKQQDELKRKMIKEISDL